MLGPLVEYPRLKITVSVGWSGPTTLTGIPPELPCQGVRPQLVCRVPPSRFVQTADFGSTGSMLTSAWKTVSAGIRVQPQKVDSCGARAP